MAARVAAWPKWAKMTVLIAFIGLVVALNIPLVAGYIDLAEDGHPSGYVVETLPDGKTREWTVVTTQVANISRTYLLTNGENQAEVSIHPEEKYFSFYRKPAGYVNFQGTICPINGGSLYYLSGSYRSGTDQFRWNGNVRFNCPATNGTAEIEGMINLR